MSTQKTPAQKQAKTDLSQQYRPLGLKAVLAAALMVKPVMKKKPA